jgi:hypothetical protein
MLVMALTGAAMAAFAGNAGNVVAGVLTAYLVITAFLTVRPPTIWARRVEIGAMTIALVLSVLCATFSSWALARVWRRSFPRP